MLRASHRRSFHLPRPQRDRVNFRQLAAIAGACLAVGVTLSGVLQRGPHTDARLDIERPDTEEAWQAAALAASPALLTPKVSAESGGLSVSETSISAATSPLLAAEHAPLDALPTAADSGETSAQGLPGFAAKAERGPAPEPTGNPQRKRHGTSASDDIADDASTPGFVVLQHGSVRYSCEADAAPTPAKRGQCPRDGALEARVWRVLARLTSCRDATNALGRAVLQLRLAPAAATNASFSAPRIARSLNLRAVSKCVAGELSKIRSTRKVDRFELEIGFGLSGGIEL